MRKSDPKSGMKVPEPPGAFLDVRFPQVEGTAVFQTGGKTLGDLFIDVCGGPPVENVASHGNEKGFIQRRFAGDQA